MSDFKEKLNNLAERFDNLIPEYVDTLTVRGEGEFGACYGDVDCLFDEGLDELRKLVYELLELAEECK